MKYKWKDSASGKYSDLLIGKQLTCGWRGIEISCFPNQREYKDGTRQYMIYLRVENADSKETITVMKVRGHLSDAKEKAEEFLNAIKAGLGEME